MISDITNFENIMPIFFDRTYFSGLPLGDIGSGTLECAVSRPRDAAKRHAPETFI
jgi:hypothetical protein